MRTAASMLGQVTRTAAMASLAAMVLATSARAELCTTLASDDLVNYVNGTTTLQVSPNGIAGECGKICDEWSSLCGKVLVGEDRCLSGLVKSLIKTYGKYCKVMDDPVDQAQCKAEVAATRDQYKTLIKNDTALVKAQCAAHVSDCLSYCTTNS